jgi:hypothetical protein
MKIKSGTLAIVLVVLFFGGIFSSDIVGLWKTESSKIAGTIENGSSIGEKDPEDIKGSFSFLDISNNYDIPVSVLEKAFQIKDVESIESFKAKDLELYYGENIEKEIGTSSIRLFVAFYKGIEFEITEEIYLPEAAVKILKEKGDIGKEKLEYIEKNTVKVMN